MAVLKSIIEEVALRNLHKNSLYGLDQETIQVKKLQNIETIYGIDSKDVLLLYDNTVFGSAKDGLVFTQKALYWREMLGSPQTMTYGELVKSTIHKDFFSGTFSILASPETIKIKENYYYLLSDLRVELVRKVKKYETDYQQALESFGESVFSLINHEAYDQVVSQIKQYKGLFLTQTSLFKRMMKEESYGELEIRRLHAIEEEDFHTAYVLYEELISLHIRSKEYLDQIELTMKEAHYQSLDRKRKRALKQGDLETAYAILENQKKLNIRTAGQIKHVMDLMKGHEYDLLHQERLQAIIDEKYDIAFFLLEKQRALDVTKESHINDIKRSMERLKKGVLEKYHHKLKKSVEERSFLESEQIITAIYKIDPLYAIEREEILLKIYKGDLDQAKQAIDLLDNKELKLQLHKIFEENSKILYEKIRQSVRNKDYHYFESKPENWHYKDEYGMLALHYFALEADIVGVEKALEATDLSLIHLNVFGHSFIDLLGLAYDFSAEEDIESFFLVLDQLQKKMPSRHIVNRINDLSSGLENIEEEEALNIQKERLKCLNRKLMSIQYLQNVFEDIQADVKETQVMMEFMYLDQLKMQADYPTKDEFETTGDYKVRCNLFKQDYLNKPDLLERYQKENQDLLDKIKIALETKGTCFIPSLSAILTFNAHGLDCLKRVKSKEGILELFNLYFPLQLPFIQIGVYNADKEFFFMRVNQTIKKMYVPLWMAERFKKSFGDLSAKAYRYIEEGNLVEVCNYQFQGKSIVLPLFTYKL